MSAKVLAPFTISQCIAISRWQRREDVHPFTCPTHSKKALYCEPDGMFCVLCDYAQAWVWDYMAGAPLDTHKVAC